MRVNKKASSDISFSRKRVVPAMCFEGANASGKTCGLRLLSFIYDFCLRSFAYAPNEPILYDTYFNNTEKSEFFIEFSLTDDLSIEYKYEAVIDKAQIYSEKLTKVRGRERKLLLKRKKDVITHNELYPEHSGIIYKDTASMISTLLQYGVKEIFPIGEFFRNLNSNVSYVSTLDDPMNDHVARYYSENPRQLDRILKYLKKWDTGISGAKIVKMLDKDGREIYLSLFSHETEAGPKELFFPFQSNGTKLLYNRLKDFLNTLDTGGVLVFDEIDTHLHFGIVPQLLNYFLDPSLNKKDAQIIFTSHSTEILDILKKYRVYLFKKIKGESISYRIDELDGNSLRRNDRSLEQMYKAGELGGMPDG